MEMEKVGKMKMSGTGLGSFHLAYVPAAETTDTAKNRSVSFYDVPSSIVIRRASSLRLYRCRSTHVHRNGQNQDGRFLNGSSSEKCSAGSADQQRSDEECQCCCCRAERCSSDPLLSVQNGGVNSTKRKTLYEDGITKNKISPCESNMLAVLVPPSLTRGLTNIITQNVDADGKVEHDGTHLVQQQIEAEIELKKSIHPCLAPTNKPRHEIQSGGVKSNRDHEGLSLSGQKYRAIEGNAKPPLGYPQLSIRGIITSNNVSHCINFPADAVLLAPVLHDGGHLILDQDHILSYYSNLLNHDTAFDAPWSVIKAFPICTLSTMEPDTNNQSTLMSTRVNLFDTAALPCCPVCLNLIEPKCLGLPELTPQQKCSQWCSDLKSHDTNNHSGYSQRYSCVNEGKLLPWPPPAECTACQEISQRALSTEIETNSMQRSLFTESPLLSPIPSAAQQTNNQGMNVNNSSLLAQSSHYRALTCHQCNIPTTLWVCLTCGVVGCGRYTLKHAAQHNALEGHPFSLELATGRIWDYENGTYVHRRDLVECPILSRKWGIAVSGAKGGSSQPSLGASSSFQRGGSNLSENNNHVEQSNEGPVDDLNQPGNDGLEDSTCACNNNHNQNLSLAESKLSAQPKKSIMINQEYEALLQSALEDQSQHYEGEISHLQAELASSRMQDIQISGKESREIHALQKDTHKLKEAVVRLSSVLVEAQAKEAKYRSVSQRLLREQTIAKELLEKIRNEILTEHDPGKVEDLEMQIADLTANAKFMSLAAQNNELSQAQICGTVGGHKGVKQRGKKSRRGRKKG